MAVCGQYPPGSRWPRLLAGAEVAGAPTDSQATMHEYEAIIYWSEEDQAFLAEVPELPGCMADGATYAEALTNAEVAIRQWIEVAQGLNRDIPVPRGRLMHA